jgi:hypothetical protein
MKRALKTGYALWIVLFAHSIPVSFKSEINMPTTGVCGFSFVSLLHLLVMQPVALPTSPMAV